MSDSVGPHRRQPTRLPHPWDSPGKNIGVGCHFLLQYIKVKNQSDADKAICLSASLPALPRNNHCLDEENNDDYDNDSHRNCKSTTCWPLSEHFAYISPFKAFHRHGGHPYCFYPPFSSRGAQERLVKSLAQVTQVVTRGARILAQAIWVPHIPPRSPCCWQMNVYAKQKQPHRYRKQIREYQRREGKGETNQG